MAEVEYKGIKVGGSKLLLILPLLGTIGGGLWGGFELWHRYQAMEAKIEKYVAPDLSGFDKRIAIVEKTFRKELKSLRSELQTIQDSVVTASDHTRDIKNDLKGDLMVIEKTVDDISKIDGNVLCGVSGGIDSTVAALLIHKAIGERLTGVFVDNGLLRLNESEEIEDMFKNNFSLNFHKIDARETFLSKLIGVSDPEEKRKIVGEEFIGVFTDFAEKKGPFKWLAQGTLYPDVIESGVSKGPAAVIKSHHNVGGLPDWLNLQVLEPLRELYKDEVRHIAKILGVPEKLLKRHPFPGPGLAVRVIGEITPAKLSISRKASKIVDEELWEAGIYDKVWQAYAAVGNDKAVGVVGDERKYGRIVTVRVVDSIDAMTADWTRLPNGVLEKISNRITNEIEEVTWVSYVISSKPPATIEPQ